MRHLLTQKRDLTDTTTQMENGSSNIATAPTIIITIITIVINNISMAKIKITCESWDSLTIDRGEYRLIMTS